MQTAPARKSLAQLRAKTDRELGILVRRELDRSLTLAGKAGYRDAERGYHTAKALLAVADLPGAERAELERKIVQLHAALPRHQMALCACSQTSY